MIKILLKCCNVGTIFSMNIIHVCIENNFALPIYFHTTMVILWHVN